MMMVVMFNLIEDSGRGRDPDCPLIVSQAQSLLSAPTTLGFAPLCATALEGALGTSADTKYKYKYKYKHKYSYKYRYKCIYKSTVHHREVLWGQSVDRLSNCLRRALTPRR